MADDDEPRVRPLIDQCDRLGGLTTQREGSPFPRPGPGAGEIWRQRAFREPAQRAEEWYPRGALIKKPMDQ